MTEVYTGTDFAFFRRGFECWAGHLFFFIHKKIKYFLFFL